MIFPFLDYLAEYSDGYIHPKSEYGTAALIKRLSPARGDKLLDFGCGCGQTIIHIHDLYQPEISGVDVSPSMLQLARSRTRHLAGVMLRLIDPAGDLPFDDGYFDKAYAESVLAILSTPNLHHALDEIYRVLKPGGAFFSNDAVWKKGTGSTYMHETNASVLRDFGLIQSNADIACHDEWIGVFEAHGFIVDATWLLADITGPAKLPARRQTPAEKLGQLTRNLRKYLLPRHYLYQRRLNAHRDVKQHLEAYLFKVTKPLHA